MKSFILLIVFLSLSRTILLAQQEEKSSVISNSQLEAIGTKFSYYGGNINTVELGFTPMWVFGSGHTPMGYWGPFLSAGLSTNKKDIYLTPRVGFDFHYFLFGSRISFSNYTNFKQSQYYLLPEVGISIIGIFNVLYGYNIKISNDENFEPDRHKISITLTLPVYDTKSNKLFFR